MKNSLEKFRANELTKNQSSQIMGSRSKRVDTISSGGTACVVITTIDRNNGTVVQRYKYYDCSKVASLESSLETSEDFA